MTGNCFSGRPVDETTALRIAVGSGGCVRAALARIEEETGWRPDDACFAPEGWWNPPAIKERLLHKAIFPVHGYDARYLAIKSNPRSREMYAKFEIPCLRVSKEGTCLTEGTRIVKRLPRWNQ